MKAILAAARASQRQDKRGGLVIEDADTAPALSVKYDATVAQVRAWYNMIAKKKENK